ncbi:FHA-domain-containing protein [Yersinia nurmii]|uniref:FHA-domain-containing protein n=1 Tax=Yersinia nurmii TaxID=685706 RepID=A0ABM9SMK4_9GAMM|nr:type VI secretion system-associated FHA domain protein TagH [Yersinia nurmii]CNF22363.1 FHA-domain-containing protein [Yersinia nurmii]
MEKQQPTLTLRVLNSDKLESGKSASCLFDIQGGRVGSGSSNLWSIQDQMSSVDGAQFAVEWQDGAFCLRVLGQPVMVNQACLTRDAGFIRLQAGDKINVGMLAMSCHIGHTLADRQDPLTLSPESLVSSYSNPLEAMMEGGEPPRGAEAPYQGNLAATVSNDFSQDPLRILQSESLTTLTQSPATDPDASQSLQQDRYSSPLFSSPLSDTAKDSAMDQEFIDLPHINRLTAIDPSETLEMREQQHVAMTPLMRGIDAQLPINNSQEAHDFLEEIGKTMKAAIDGLLALQQVQHGLSDKHLRPIEDNPLRLNLDYDTTMNVLFADQKSPVHLAAPAAVAESLNNVRLHHQANQTAIGVALATMLDAFSPQHLLARFAHYRRSNERQEMDAAWAWDMYNSYYQELASSRQQGFEKLFWEVYAQSYDRALRQGLQESAQ